MTARSDTAPSKGMSMINAYRTERLNQRLVLRTGLQQVHMADHLACGTDPAKTDPAKTDPAAVTEMFAAKAPKDTKSSDSNDPEVVVAVSVSRAVAEATLCIEAAPEPPLTPVVRPDNPFELTMPSTDDPPLTEIGFGPCMLIRLSQLGLYTMADLAQADAVQLRAALGDISRLVDVEAWINSAQRRNASRIL